MIFRPPPPQFGQAAKPSKVKLLRGARSAGAPPLTQTHAEVSRNDDNDYWRHLYENFHGT